MRRLVGHHPGEPKRRLAVTRSSRIHQLIAIPLAAACAGLGAGVCAAQDIHETVRFAPADLGFAATWGGCVAIDENLLVIGVYYPHYGISSVNLATLHDLTTGAIYAPLVPPDPVQDGYATSVAIDGATAAVASNESVFVFDVGDPFEPALLHEITVSTSPNNFPVTQIEISDGLLFASWGYREPFLESNGEVLVFNLTTAEHLSTITPPEPYTDFARSFAVDGDTLLVGAPGFDGSDPYGNLYSYDISTPEAPVLLSNLGMSGISTDYYYFGGRVGAENGIAFAVVSNGRAVVIDYADPSAPVPLAVFQATSYYSDPSRVTVDFEGDLVVLGTALHDSGDAPLIDLSDPTAPFRAARFVPSDGYTDPPGTNTDRQFGSAAAISGNRVVIGASSHDWRDTAAGAAYLFDLPADPGPCTIADLAEPFGILDLADIAAFIDGFTTGCTE
jgi:hypothetical protein